MACHLKRAVLLTCIILTACGAAPPDFRRLAFHDNRASMDGVTVQLEEPDQPDHPTAWQGPLTIVGRCTANLSLITSVYVSRGSPYLIAITYSGSTRYARYIDAQTCRESWPANTATSDLSIAGDDLATGAGRHWQLFSDRPPKQR
jgi:hypothetical protein